MNVTTKESGLLKDLKNQEQLCVEKYSKYADEASSEELKQLLRTIADQEREHLRTVTEMMGGKVETSATASNGSAVSSCCCARVSYSADEGKKKDAYLCSDLLATEKHASSLYDTCVFEFTDPQARKVLNHIQAEEQEHGLKLYDFMSNNGMYS